MASGQLARAGERQINQNARPMASFSVYSNRIVCALTSLPLVSCAKEVAEVRAPRLLQTAFNTDAVSLLW